MLCFEYRFPWYSFYSSVISFNMDELQKEKIGQDLAVTLPSMQLKVFRLLKTIKVLLLYQRECYSMLLLSGITLASIIQASRCASGATVLYKLSCLVLSCLVLLLANTPMESNGQGWV